MNLGFTRVSRHTITELHSQSFLTLYFETLYFVQSDLSASASHIAGVTSVYQLHNTEDISKLLPSVVIKALRLWKHNIEVIFIFFLFSRSSLQSTFRNKTLHNSQVITEAGDSILMSTMQAWLPQVYRDFLLLMHNMIHIIKYLLIFLAESYNCYLPLKCYFLGSSEVLDFLPPPSFSHLTSSIL